MTIDIEKLEWEVIEKLDPDNYGDTRRVINYLHLSCLAVCCEPHS